MKLFYMPGACSLATHIILRETGEPFELEKVGRDKKTDKGADFLKLNPKGYVPALQLDDGEIVTENIVIHQYLADHHASAYLLPKHGTRERLRVDQLMVYVSTEIHKSYSPLFNPAFPEEVKVILRDKLVQRYGLIEELLSDGRTWLTGEQFSTVDAYLFTVSRWSKNTGVDLSKFPGVIALNERIATRPGVKAALEAEGLAKAP
ncbi:MAG: glutathione transferase GstA [Alphaproteobacteria bacterium]|nr:glutathione transferase GstA [Alphaproteobacteria bacterium]